MIASLGMYDRAELRSSTDLFWHLIQEQLGHGPAELTRDRDLWDIWQSPDMIFSQTCGMPYRTRLHPHVALVGTPDYGLTDCPAGYYRSLFIVRKSDAKARLTDYSGAKYAYNEGGSQSGWAGPIWHTQQAGLRFGAYLQTGAHVASARAVAEGAADIAAVDAQTWRLIERFDDFAAMLTVIDATTPTPVLPYITARADLADALFTAVTSAITALPDSDRRALGLRRIVKIPPKVYLSVPTPPSPDQIDQTK